ncbi:MAG: FtsX-like permease family protein [Spirochaetaceae bacterium]|jgi:ABC-type lipoprotein release transport system permease subunit|nr:FtsX-like permease family protein [Spirochaetaceae bacterium]
MRTKELWLLAVNYVINYRRRYLFLFCALAFGFCIVSVMGSLKDGMSDAVYYSARNHYSGDIIIAGFEKEMDADNHIYAESIPLIQEKIEKTGIKPQKEVMRTMQNQDSFIHYNGGAVPVKYVSGVDWEAERDYFDTLNFTEGPSSDFGGDTIIISAPIALLLGARLGDLVLLETETLYGQKNTAFFTIGGIIDDRSIFGYFKIFAARRAINNLIGFAPDDCSTIGLFFDEDTESIENKREKLQKALTGVVPLRPLVYDRDGFDREQDWRWSGVMFFLLTASVYLSDVSQILQALNILSYFLYIMMLLIILVSAGVTYRLILHERTREIGAMRAIGFYENDIRRVLLLEAFILASVSLVTGFCFTLFINWIVSCLPFSWFPGFDIFLKNGRLLALYNPAAMAINIAAIYVILSIAVYAPAFRSSRSPLPDMLSGEGKG